MTSAEKKHQKIRKILVRCLRGFRCFAMRISKSWAETSFCAAWDKTSLCLDLVLVIRSQVWKLCRDRMTRTRASKVPEMNEWWEVHRSWRFLKAVEIFLKALKLRSGSFSRGHRKDYLCHNLSFFRNFNTFDKSATNIQRMKSWLVHDCLLDLGYFCRRLHDLHDPLVEIVLFAEGIPSQGLVKP